MAEMTTSLSFQRDAWGRLVLLSSEYPEGQVVEPVRAFPWSASQQELILINPQGQPVLSLTDWESLSTETRGCLRDELHRREFLPQLQRILSVTGPYPPCRWQVETDRGVTEIELESEEDIRRLSEHAALITDSSGLRFHIPDVTQLDRVSRGYLRRYL